MKPIISTAALAAALAATPSLAQDRTELFTGPYAAATVGIDSLVVDDGTDSESEEGVVYGAILGYDFATANAVFGVEAELSESSIGIDDTNVLVAGDNASFGAGRDIYVGARAGIFASDSGILYVKGGYTNQKFDLDYTAPGISLEDSSNAEGFRVGAGGEFRLADNLTARVEYRYSNYGELEFNGAALGVDLERHQGMATVAYRF